MSHVKEWQPLPGVRVFTVSKDDRFRVLVASVDVASNAAALSHVANCDPDSWRAMHSFATDTNEPAAFSCMYPRDLADDMLDALNGDARLSRAMRLAFNVSAPCEHREGKMDPKLGGTWLRNHVLYHLHRRFRGTRAWSALLHEGTAPDAFHADGFEQLRRPPGTDYFTVLRYPNDASWADGWGGDFLLAPYAQYTGRQQREASEARVGLHGAVLRVAPRPDRLVVFSGQLLHRSSPPTSRWPPTATPAGLAAAPMISPQNRSRLLVPAMARWRVASVMQLLCRNDAYFGPYEGADEPPALLPRLVAMAGALLAVAYLRGDIQLGGAEPPSSSAAGGEPSAAAAGAKQRRGGAGGASAAPSQRRKGAGDQKRRK